MKHRLTLFLLLSVCLLTAVASSRQLGDKISSVSISRSKEIKLTPELINKYASTQQRTSDAFRVATNTVEWKNYVIMLNQQETMLVAIQAELGIKPLTDKCKPVFMRDGKRTLDDGTPVDASNGILDHFECLTSEDKKP